MVHLFQHHPARFHDRYRYRVNVEGRFSSTKRCQGPSLMARRIWTQRREYGWCMASPDAEQCARPRLRASLS
jgi:hypothetical protein